MIEKKFSLHNLLRCICFQWARIHFAARNGYTETVKVLAKKKANLNAKGKYKVKNC